MRPVERLGFAQSLRRLLHDMRRDRTAEKLRPGDRRKSDGLALSKPPPEPSVFQRRRDEGSDEETRIQVDHARLPDAARAGLPLRANLSLPHGGNALGKTKRLLRPIERG